MMSEIATKQYMREYYQNNKEDILKRIKANYKKNAEKIIMNKKLNRKERYIKDKDTLQKYYLKNRKKILIIMKKYRDINKEQINKVKRNWWKEKTPPIRQKLFQILGNKCCRCGYSDIRALQLDHLLGDGYLERNKSNKYYVENPLEAIFKFQLLCANCNWIKRVEQKEYKRYKHE